ncbi:putative lipoyltransferase-like protein [Botrytis fragariae]|uniref:Putative lipoate-protein ligase A n=1 Tax=Botrytis fragariae TaxID=1964551 RepID=A0A8H6EEP1_9HELO|nr:putative lipoyltransferase-like protein [Botrytis fragariae]KAF5869537.1 putative lipoyltransferase-like protein [Botrytis fragariae]
MYQKSIIPSRGLMRQFVLRGRSTITKGFFVRRNVSTHSSVSIGKFVQEATNPANKSQIYISRTNDPFINLSIEHYLLQKTPADSTILFLYTNERSIVIGRNQNPWNEVNLGLLAQSPIGDVALVRRRSGGGTVFHDLGNVNYCVICPTSHFDRDKHAEMVVRALHKLGVDRAMVNARHDIVLKPTDVGTSGFKVFKVSGSAYKLTKERSLHHGTCLLNSPNIADIGKFLRSPAMRFITARGVESVSSSVANVKIQNKAFEQAVVEEFSEMYGPKEPILLREDVKEVPEISKGLEELTSLDWIFSQTPQFLFSADTSIKNKNTQLPLPRDLPPYFKANFTARNGAIIEADVEYKENGETVQIGKDLVNKKIHEIEWNMFPSSFAEEPLKWFSRLFSHKFVDWRRERKRDA